MCQSQRDGGLRCAAHTRPRFEAAAFGTPEWDDAAAAHASTRAGGRELSNLADQAEAVGDIERVVAIEHALVKGQRLREASVSANAAISGLPVSAAILVAPPRVMTEQPWEHSQAFNSLLSRTHPDFRGELVVSDGSTRLVRYTTTNPDDLSRIGYVEHFVTVSATRRDGTRQVLHPDGFGYGLMNQLDELASNGRTLTFTVHLETGSFAVGPDEEFDFYETDRGSDRRRHVQRDLYTTNDLRDAWRFAEEAQAKTTITDADLIANPGY